MKILVSSCLLGEKVRFDGKSKSIENIERLSRYHELISFCPEVAGGLSVPREACEILGNSIEILNNNKNSSRVISRSGEDKTAEFLCGAGKALNLCKEQGIVIAILKSKSPSCGIHKVYDGTHSRTLTDGNGITAQLLLDNNIRVLDEDGINYLLDDCNI